MSEEQAAMLIPYGTDAPIYYRPIATVTIIVLNVLMFLLTGMGHVAGVLHSPYRWLINEFDQINPLQWVTSACMHASWMHLIGNMVFLWCFGLVVEGKLGWKRFSIVYLVLCLADGALSQIPMFILYGGSGLGPPGCLGASGVIFALIAISICWAPENSVHCLFVWSILFPVYPMEFRIISLGLFYGALELLPMIFGGFRMSTPLLHLLGMSAGIPVAIYMLKKNLVDCEGWDVLSRYGDPTPRILAAIRSLGGRVPLKEPAKQTRPGHKSAGHDDAPYENAVETILQNPDAFNPIAAQKANPLGMRDRRNFAFVAFQKALVQDDATKASEIFREIREHWGTHPVSNPMLVKYASVLGRHALYAESLVPLKVLVSRRAECANQACLRIARIQLQINRDPEAAGATLSQIREPMDSETRQKKQQLAGKIQASVNV